MLHEQSAILHKKSLSDQERFAKFTSSHQGRRWDFLTGGGGGGGLFESESETKNRSPQPHIPEA